MDSKGQRPASNPGLAAELSLLERARLGPVAPKGALLPWNVRPVWAVGEGPGGGTSLLRGQTERRTEKAEPSVNLS